MKITANNPDGLILEVQNTEYMMKWTYKNVKEYETTKKELIITFLNNDVIKVNNSVFD